MIRSSRFLALAAAAAATAAFPAHAGEAIPSSEVRYADLNLSSPTGAKALQARVERAAKRVCGVGQDRSLQAAAAAGNCAKVAIARAMPQVELALANAAVRVADSGRMSVAAH